MVLRHNLIDSLKLAGDTSACNSMGLDPVIQEYRSGGDLLGNISMCRQHQ